MELYTGNLSKNTYYDLGVFLWSSKWLKWKFDAVEQILTIHDLEDAVFVKIRFGL